jgi:solute carrier family 25 carnitine/acylcarnitine transporter 20/29
LTRFSFLSTATVVSQHKSISYFDWVLTNETAQLLQDTPGLTLFLPVDEAWEKLDELERLYLESEFASDDLNRIVKMHAVTGSGVAWSETFEPAVNREFSPYML